MKECFSDDGRKACGLRIGQVIGGRGWRTGNWPFALAAAAFLSAPWLVGLKEAFAVRLAIHPRLACLMGFLFQFSTHSSAFPNDTNDASQAANAANSGKVEQPRMQWKKGIGTDTAWGDTSSSSRCCRKCTHRPFMGFLIGPWEEGENPIDGSTLWRPKAHTHHLRWQLFPLLALICLVHWLGKGQGQIGICRSL